MFSIAHFKFFNIYIFSYTICYGWWSIEFSIVTYRHPGWPGNRLLTEFMASSYGKKSSINTTEADAVNRFELSWGLCWRLGREVTRLIRLAYRTSKFNIQIRYGKIFSAYSVLPSVGIGDPENSHFATRWRL